MRVRNKVALGIKPYYNNYKQITFSYWKRPVQLTKILGTWTSKNMSENFQNAASPALTSD